MCLTALPRRTVRAMDGSAWPTEFCGIRNEHSQNSLVSTGRPQSFCGGRLARHRIRRRRRAR